MEIAGGEAVVPASIDVERQVIAALLSDHDAAIEACSSLDEGDFFLREYKLLFGVAKELVGSGKTMDATLVASHLQGSKVVADIGGMDYVANILINSPLAHVHISEYINTLKEKSKLRNTMMAAMGVIKAIQAGATVKQLEKKVGDVSRAFIDSEQGGSVNVESLTEKSLADFEARALKGGPDLTWGIGRLDDITGGIRKGETTIIGARTSQGKTSTTLNIALRNLEVGKRVMYVAFENLGQIMPRLTALRNLQPLDWFLRPYKCTADERKLFRASMESVRDAYGSTLTIMGPTKVSKVRAILEAKPHDLVVFDYVQRYSVAFTENDSRHVAVSRAFNDMYSLAEQVNCATLVLSQISRADDKTRRRAPILEELKESGDLECFSDNIILLWWKWKETLDDTDDMSNYQIHVAKNKLGPTQKIHVQLDPRTLKITG